MGTDDTASEDEIVIAAWNELKQADAMPHGSRYLSRGYFALEPFDFMDRPEGEQPYKAVSSEVLGALTTIRKRFRVDAAPRENMRPTKFHKYLKQAAGQLRKRVDQFAPLPEDLAGVIVRKASLEDDPRVEKLFTPAFRANTPTLPVVDELNDIADAFERAAEYAKDVGSSNSPRDLSFGKPFWAAMDRLWMTFECCALSASSAVGKPFHECLNLLTDNDSDRHQELSEYLNLRKAHAERMDRAWEGLVPELMHPRRRTWPDAVLHQVLDQERKSISGTADEETTRARFAAWIDWLHGEQQNGRLPEEFQTIGAGNREMTIAELETGLRQIKYAGDKLLAQV